MIKRIFKGVFIATVASVLLYAGFDIQWWVPTEGIASARELSLVLIHLAGLVVWPIMKIEE